VGGGSYGAISHSQIHFDVKDILGPWHIYSKCWEFWSWNYFNHGTALGSNGLKVHPWASTSFFIKKHQVTPRSQKLNGTDDRKTGTEAVNDNTNREPH
jgi:hypothetical protein